MNKQEVLKRIEAQKETILEMTGWAVYVYMEELIKSIDEPKKVVVPQFVADWIETAKTVYSLSGGMTFGGTELNKWLAIDDNQETFARAWLDGYEVEKEKRYYVRLKNVDENYNYLNYIKSFNAWALTEIKKDKKFRSQHTRQELEEGGFGEVFDSPLFEIEEVE